MSEVLAAGAHSSRGSLLLLPVTHPHRPGGVSGCLPLAGTQDSVIMTSSSVTLSIASRVRFRFPMTSLALPLVALTTPPGFVNTGGSSGLLAGQAVSSVSRVHLSRECRKEPSGWAQMERTVFLSHPALYSFPGACTTSTSAPSAFYPMLQGCGLLGAHLCRVDLLPKLSLIEKTDGEAQFRMISLVGSGVG